jgi:Kef-type K+ transport system membrane component KefB
MFSALLHDCGGVRSVPGTVETLTELIKLLLLAAVAVALLGRLRLPPVVSYVLLGAATGPHALGWLGETATIHFLGELGIAFLLFTLGLDFSISQFVAMRLIPFIPSIVARGSVNLSGLPPATAHAFTALNLCTLLP